MADHEWRDFRAATRAAVESAGTVYFFGDGLGVYGDEFEESHTVVGQARDEEALDKLRETLTRLASRYRQEAIALTVGEVEFLG
jgi:hypothetical protein